MYKIYGVRRSAETAHDYHTADRQCMRHTGWDILCKRAAGHLSWENEFIPAEDDVLEYRSENYEYSDDFREYDSEDCE